MVEFKKGTVWNCQLDILGGKVRPCIVISSDDFNSSYKNKHINVIPLSTSLDNDHYHWNIIDGTTSQILPEFTCPVHKMDFRSYVGTLDNAEMDIINSLLMKHFFGCYTDGSGSKEDKKEKEVKKETKTSIKYSYEEKISVLKTYDNAIKNNDAKMIQALADEYCEGNKTKLSKLVSYFRKYEKKSKRSGTDAK